jgi:hypothetical protein
VGERISSRVVAAWGGELRRAYISLHETNQVQDFQTLPSQIKVMCAVRDRSHREKLKWLTLLTTDQDKDYEGRATMLCCSRSMVDTLLPSATARSSCSTYQWNGDAVHHHHELLPLNTGRSAVNLTRGALRAGQC